MLYIFTLLYLYLVVILVTAYRLIDPLTRKGSSYLVDDPQIFVAPTWTAQSAEHLDEVHEVSDPSDPLPQTLFRGYESEDSFETIPEFRSITKSYYNNPPLPPEFDPTLILAMHLGNISYAYDLVKSKVPPLDATPGINDVTEFFQSVLPQSTRDRIVALTPETGLGTLNNVFWNSLNAAASEYTLNRTEFQSDLPPEVKQLQEEFLEFSEAINGVSAYKKFKAVNTWKALQEARDLLYEPYAEVKKNITDTYDAVFARASAIGGLKTLTALTPAFQAKQNLEHAYAVKTANANKLLAPYHNVLRLYRGALFKGYLASTSGFQALQICAWNPVCCETPELCPPLE